jgi:hypothetical protein
MEKYTIDFSVEEIHQILNKHMGVKDTRIHCLSSPDRLGWEGIRVSVYDENENLNKSWEKFRLYDANPNCKHNMINAPGGGIKCTNCKAWFCY